jgi:integrase/recombinase XerD
VSDLAPILQGFFRVKLIQQKDASPHTISSYRDAWRLLLHYAQQTTGTPPERMRLGQLDHELVTGFLRHLETERGNSARTRNNRLAAIHSLFRYAALHALDDAEVIQQVLAIESARTDDQEVSWLTAEEAAAVLAAPDRSRWVGRRDHAMMAVLLATGLRVSELLSLTRADARIQAAGSHIRCTGKGRRDRSTPLDPATAAVLSEWLDSTDDQPGDPLFPARGRTGQKQLTRDGFQARLDKYQKIATQEQPSLADKRLFPHLFRHTRAMNMRLAGHDVSIIALWLGHQDVSSTMKYLHADLKLKERALDRTAATGQQLGRYQPSDTVLDFLDSLTSPTRE